MLKGTTKIELTDIHTGEKQVIEKHNMVTSAISQLFQPTLGHLTQESILRDSIPAYSGLFGGLLLFDGNIAENINTVYAPSGVNLTGCARYNYVNTGTSVKIGSYNLTESVYDATNRKMTYVYDFNTSQGNGTIASVCLTNVDAGYGTYGSDLTYSTSLARNVHNSPKSYIIGGKDMYSGVSVGQYEHLFYIDPANDLAYYFTVTDATHLAITKRRLGLKTFSLFSNEVKLMETLQLTVLGIALDSYKCYNFDTEDNALYIFSAPSSTISINGTFHVTKIQFSTWAITQYTLSNTGDSVLYSGSNRWAFAHKGFCYIMGNVSPYCCYKIEISNTVNITKMTGNTGSYLCIPIFALNGLVYFQYQSGSKSSIGTTRLYIADSELDKLKFCGNSYAAVYYYNSYYYTPAFTPVKDYPMFFYLSLGGSGTPTFNYMCHYLATINNLTEPVVKTADKTMKVTYILQEAT